MKKYLEISNAEEKKWILPLKNMSTALEIYQPAGWKGKLIKRALPAAAFIGIIPIKHSFVSINEVISRQIMDSIIECFGINAEVSFFGGTPGTHMKPTIQVFRGKELLGYVKYSNNPNVILLFKNEMEILKYLSLSGVYSIPSCLKCNETREGNTIFIQNTEKKVRSKTLHSFSNIHKEFLNELRVKTRKLVLFEKTDFFWMLEDLKKRINVLSVEEQIIVKKYIDSTIDYYKRKIVEYSVCHRDFTPWNSCIVDKKLYVFDWEYAKKLYPKGMDKARFLVEVARRERHLEPSVIMKSVRINRRALINYILDNLYIYLERGQESDYDNIHFNIDLLKCVGTK